MPVLGQIAAGVPITAEEVVEDVFRSPARSSARARLFLLKVVGDSMIDAAICDGDWVVVRQQPTADNGDIVAAMLDNEATGQDLQAQGRQGLAAAAQRRVLADRRRPRDDPRQGHGARRSDRDVGRAPAARTHLSVGQSSRSPSHAAGRRQEAPRRRPDPPRPTAPTTRCRATAPPGAAPGATSRRSPRHRVGSGAVASHRGR